MAALNGHVDSVQLLLDLGASVTEVTMEDGTTIDLIGNSHVLFTNLTNGPYLFHSLMILLLIAIEHERQNHFDWQLKSTFLHVYEFLFSSPC